MPSVSWPLFRHHPFRSQLCQVISLPSAILLVLVQVEAGGAEDSLEKIVGKKKTEEEQGMLELTILGN